MQARKSRHLARNQASRHLMTGVAGASAVIAGTVLLNALRANRAETKYPAIGEFITVDGVLLHYVERGAGTPIVLVHGNATMVQDWMVSGLFDALAKSHRVIAFDRPGFGYSDRPRSRVWTPIRQANILAQALASLGVSSATVVGHSLGTQVAIALALDHADAVARLVLLGGYYFPSVRSDALLAVAPAIPILGDILSHTVSPLFSEAMIPAVNAKLFAPAKVPAAWKEDFPFDLMLRPSQIHAESADGAMMVPTAARLSKRYAELTLPITIVAGAGDLIADPVKQSGRLNNALPQSQLLLVPNAGHMVHHTALAAVLESIETSLS